MPEGDSYTRVAALLRPAFVGVTLTAVDGVPAVRRWSDRLIGARVEGVRTRGKHLLIDICGDITIHVWMGMPGWWRIGPKGGVGRTEGERTGSHDSGDVRLLIGTIDHIATCHAAPVVEVDRRRVIERTLRRIGPDVLDAHFDLDEYRTRVALLPGTTLAADLLLDQRVLAGVGNEYKNEVLFLEGIHPCRLLQDLTGDQIDGLANRSRRIMLPNAERGGARDTTGLPGMEGWVYQRAGKPCRRCRTAILTDRVGERHPRVTFWCPLCQPG
ncbi:MAG: DNA-formamidopyrimidine glycosylase family protein [Acidimicrobiia bacterium]